MCFQGALVLACSLTLPLASTLYTAAPEAWDTLGPRGPDILQPQRLGYSAVWETGIHCSPRVGYTVAQKLGYTTAPVSDTL